MSRINRRQFLLLSAAGAMTSSLGNWAIAQSNQIAPSFSQLYQSNNGLLELDLEATPNPIQLDNRQAYLLTYNAQTPGPRLEAKPGDRVKINFTNNLSQATNLHYHGLHITPTGNADNVFLSIPPNERLTYDFTIPSDHRAGTFWYHPHHHGHVAEQLFGGLAGLFIVRGDLDEIPEIKAAKEEFLILQDFDLDSTGGINPPNHMALMMGREGPLITINGRVNPVFSIPSNSLLRLRLLNASAARFYRLALENHSFYLIATDGGAISEPIELSELLLAPGERAEVLIKGDREPNQYRLLNLPYDRGGMMMGGMGGMGGMRPHHRGSQSTYPQSLATFTYQESNTSLPLPDKLIEVESLPEPDHIRRIELSMSMGMGMGMGMAFLFNGKTFDPKRIDIEAKLNTIEDWELVNVDPDRMDHPFHLHVNPFQIVSRNGQPEPYRAWKDTVLIPGEETVRIRIPFRNFTGTTVYHCHILDHEDLGMMGTVNILTLPSLKGRGFLVHRFHLL